VFTSLDRSALDPGGGVARATPSAELAEARGEAWVTLGILEFLVGLILVASLVRLEFLAHREKSLLQVGWRSRCSPTA
jgi:hypothetical protein